MDMAVTDGGTGVISNVQHALRSSGYNYVKRVFWPLGAEAALLLFEKKAHCRRHSGHCEKQ
eukprot:12137480-Alexandrium_andersonii.AAC.1